MKRLHDAHELLDGSLDDPAALQGNLRDLARVNRWTGGITLSRKAIDFLVPPPEGLSMLDVGTGAADIPVALLAQANGHRRAFEVTATDSRDEVLAAARAITPGLDAIDGLHLAEAEGRKLPYSDRSFDIGHASLVLHHLDPPDAVAFLRELARVSRHGIVVNDLSRRPITFIGAWVLSRVLTTNRYTRHDAPLSARRPYTVNEAYRLLAGAGLEPVYLTRGLAGHRWAIAAVRADT